MFHQPYGLAVRDWNRFWWFIGNNIKKTTVRYGSTDLWANLPPNHPAGKTVLQHRTPVISERLSKSDGFIDSNQSIQLRWGDFFFGVSPLTAFHISGKVPGTHRHRLHGLPRIPLPGHTRKIEFPNTMSTFKFSLFGSNLSFAGILFLILFRGNLFCYIQNRKFNLSLMNLFILVWKNYYPLLFVVTFLNLNKWTVCFVLNVMTVQILSRQNFFSLMMNFNGKDI